MKLDNLSAFAPKDAIEGLRLAWPGVLETVDEWRNLEKRRIELEDEKESRKKAARPTAPIQIEDPEEWFAYVERVAQYDERSGELEAQTWRLKQEMDTLEKPMKAALPAGIWFRHGDIGFGIAHTNWGGFKTYLTVTAWSEKMPSLDHSYHGD